MLAKKKLLGGYLMKETWLTVNTIKDLKLTESVLKKKVHEGTWLK